MIAEVVDGELSLQPRPARKHARTAGRVFGRLMTHFEIDLDGKMHGWVFGFEPELHLGGDILVPDVAAWRVDRHPGEDDEPFFTDAPGWLCELLSPSTARFDRAKKVPVCGRERVPFVWLVDPRDRTIEVLRLGDECCELLGTWGGDEGPFVREPFESAELPAEVFWPGVGAQGEGTRRGPWALIHPGMGFPHRRHRSRVSWSPMSFSSRALFVAVALLAPAVCFSACKGDDDKAATTSTDPAGAGGEGGASGGAGASGTGGTGIDVGGSGPSECALESKKAEPVPLDLFVMLDQSTSMDRVVSTGNTKWQAVTHALEGFFSDGKSSGIGAGIQYFGQVDTAVPATCNADADCGGKGPCEVQKACVGTPEFRFCESGADCSGKPCEALGTCTAQPNVTCFLSDGPKCGLLGGKDLGECKLAPGYCLGRDSCDVAGYATPAAEIAALPEAAPSLVASMAAHKPVSGTTPTGPALQGALAHASEWAKAHPDHVVAVVLATDGLPTGACTPLDPTDIAALASTAKAASPAVGTYVIGVFAADEVALAKPNLDEIAKAGSDVGAFLVTADASTSTQFLEAMNSIRKTALTCDFHIPTPDSTELDFGKINVRLSGTEVLNVPSADKCAEAGGGWYYDVDPASGEAPTKVVLCPTDCAKFKDTSGVVDVVIGCATKVAPIK